MDNEKVSYFLKAINKNYNIPIVFCTDENKFERFQPFDLVSSENNFEFIYNRLKEKINTSKSSVFYDINKQLVMIGVVLRKREDGKDDFIVVGPCPSMHTNQEHVKEYLDFIKVTGETYDQLFSYLNNSRKLYFEQFLNILGQINLVLNDSIKSKNDFTIIADYTSSVDDEKDIKSKTTKNDYYSDENIARKRNAIDGITKKLNYCMRKGLVELLPNVIQEMSMIDDGDLSNGYIIDDFKNMKTAALGAVFSAHTTAVNSGIPSSSVDGLKYYYLNKIDMAKTMDELNKCSIGIIYDFTKAVKNGLKYVTGNPTVNRIINYIGANINSKLTVSKIADDLGISSNYIFVNFKKETGRTINDFITDEKIKKAEYYLLFTDKSLIEISELLSFSSQCYFQKVFKDVKGITPREYKLKSAQINN